MKNFIKNNKLSTALAAVLIIFTILLCIPATIKIFAGVFGYIVYLYLALGYVALVLRIKKIRLNVTKPRFVLFLLTFIFAVLTLHVGIGGKTLVEGGFGSYVGGSYDTATVGGVLFSLISLPVVLPCKYVASVVIFFVLTALCGFLIIFPYVFERTSRRTKTPVRIEREEGGETESLPVHTLPEEKDEFSPPEKEKTLEVFPEPEPLPEPEDKRAAARRLLFGTDEVRKPTFNNVKPKSSYEPKPSYENPLREKSDKNPFDLTSGLGSYFNPPPAETYTNEHREETRKKAREVLFGQRENPVAQNFSATEMSRESEPTLGETLGSSMKVNPYFPSSTLYETPEKEDIEEEKAPFSPYIPTPVAETYAKPTVSETDNKFAEPDDFPTVANDSFVAAVRSSAALDGPAPLQCDEPVTPAPEPAFEQPKPVFEQPKPVFEKPKPTVPEPKKVAEPVVAEEIKPEEPKKAEIKPPKVIKPYVAPKITSFVDHVEPKFSPYVENYAELKEVFEVKLKNFNIDVTLIDVVKGPTITFCILDLSEKCPISKVFAIKQDISRLLKTGTTGDINIVPKIPNSSYFGIEIPNAVKGIVSFKEVLASPDYANAKGDLVLALGKTNAGKMVIDDLADMPHALIAGSTGSGKSVCINAILASLLYRYSPDELKLILIDLKIVEMANFAGLPHMLFKNPLNEIPEVINALKWLKEETFRRFNTFKPLHVRNIKEYNAKVDKSERMPRIVIIIDEASELMTDPNGRKTLESTLSSLARVARAAGVHMIFATQNPVKEVITNEIQNNLNTKIAFAVGDYVHSMVIFKAPGAEKLLGKGDMIIKKGSIMQRAQCAYVSTDEIEDMVDYIKQNNDIDFDDDMIDRILHGSKEEITPAPEVKPTASLPEKKDFDNDESFQLLVKEALRIFVETEKVSGTYIQRRFSKGYNTIANVMDYLEEKGYISAQVNNKRRLLITKEEFYNLYPDEKPEVE